VVVNEEAHLEGEGKEVNAAAPAVVGLKELVRDVGEGCYGW
jgi:hypothetical protein